MPPALGARLFLTTGLPGKPQASFFFCFVLATPHGLQESVSQPGIEPRALAVRARCPNHEATRELPTCRFLTFLKALGALVLCSWHSHLVSMPLHWPQALCLLRSLSGLASVSAHVCHPVFYLFSSMLCGWRRRWHSTPVLLPGKSHGRRSLVGCSPWGREESDTTEQLPFHFSLSCIGEGNGNPLQCSCLENPRDGGAWWAAVSGVAQSQTQLK